MSTHDGTAGMLLTVVDDEAALRDILVRTLAAWGYACQTAGNAERALDLLESRPTPLVITDLRMPGQGGLWLVREVRRTLPGTGLIVLTAGDDSDAAMHCLNAGADRYLRKPLNMEELHHAVETTLHRVELEQERERYRVHLEKALRRQMRRVRHTFLSAIDSLVRTLEARDPYTKGHSLRVRHYALRLADELKLDGRLRRELSLAAKLHDIGKVGIPESILNKPGDLTGAEYEVICRHTLIGERILSPIIRNRTVLAAIRSHHERLDGQGYPDGLHGDAVPQLARIIAVVDCYDALTTSRAYRKALPRAQALDILRAGAGTQFEPEIVEAWVAIRERVCHAAPLNPRRTLP
jgi:putative two-component system response regulator